MDLVEAFYARPMVGYKRGAVELGEPWFLSMDLKVHLARQFAITHHANQKYGDYLYVAHLDDVLFLAHLVGVTSLDLLQATLLHDVIEDTDVSKIDVMDNFGTIIAEVVDGVSNDPSLSRVEQSKALNAHLVELNCLELTSSLVIILKMLDRLANALRVLGRKRPLLKVALRYNLESKEFMDASYRKNSEFHSDLSEVYTELRNALSSVNSALNQLFA